MSDISVPIDISAAAFRTASRSSGSMVSNVVVAAFVRKPEFKVRQCQKIEKVHRIYPLLVQLLHRQYCRQ